MGDEGGIIGMWLEDDLVEGKLVELLGMGSHVKMMFEGVA